MLNMNISDIVNDIKRRYEKEKEDMDHAFEKLETLE